MGTPSRGPVNDPRAAQRAALRKATIHLIAGVVLLDAVAMAIYYGAGLAYAPNRMRTTFLVVWTVATAMVVAILLRRVRLVRLGKR